MQTGRQTDRQTHTQTQGMDNNTSSAYAGGNKSETFFLYRPIKSETYSYAGGYKVAN